MTDTTFIPNKRCKCKGCNKFYKSKNGLKISTLLDDNRIPLLTKIVSGNNSDIKIFEKFKEIPNIGELYVKKRIGRPKNRYLLTDKGYSCKSGKEIARHMGFKLFAPVTYRNTKDPLERARIYDEYKMSKKEKLIYKNRIKVENYYAHIHEKTK